MGGLTTGGRRGLGLGLGLGLRPGLGLGLGLGRGLGLLPGRGLGVKGLGRFCFGGGLVTTKIFVHQGSIHLFSNSNVINNARKSDVC